MRKISKFYFKVMIKNILFIFMLLGVTFFSANIGSTASMSLTNYTGFSSFALIISASGIMIICAYVSGKRYNLLEYLEENIYKRFISMLLSSIYIISILYLINVVIIIINLNSDNLLIFNITGFIHFSLTWYLTNMLASCIGLLVGTFMPSFYRYFVSIVLFLPFIKGLTKGDTTSLFGKLLNVFDDQVTSPRNHGSGIVLNTFYILDKIFILLFILLIIGIIYLYSKKRNYKYIALSLIIFFTVQGIVVNSANRSIKIVDSENAIEASAASKKIDLPYYIEDYSMELNLKNNLSNKCHIKIKLENQTSEIKFKLDNVFEINNLKINNKSVDYKRHENEVIIPLKNPDLKSNSLDLFIDYTGSVYISNNIGTDISYVSYNSVQLLSDIINWYPTIESNKEFNLNIKGTSSSKLYSNLNIESTKQESLYTFKASGKTNSLNIVSGNYGEYTYNGVKVISPKGNFYTHLERNLDSYIDHLANENFSGDKANKIKNKEYTKILVISGVYGVHNILGDTLIIGWSS